MDGFGGRRIVVHRTNSKVYMKPTGPKKQDYKIHVVEGKIFWRRPGSNRVVTCKYSTWKKWAKKPYAP